MEWSFVVGSSWKNVIWIVWMYGHSLQLFFSLLFSMFTFAKQHIFHWSSNYTEYCIQVFFLKTRTNRLSLICSLDLVLLVASPSFNGQMKYRLLIFDNPLGVRCWCVRHETLVPSTTLSSYFFINYNNVQFVKLRLTNLISSVERMSFLMCAVGWQTIFQWSNEV